MNNNFDFENCTKNGVPCCCRDCMDIKCKEEECSLCCNCDEYLMNDKCQYKKQNCSCKNEMNNMVVNEKPVKYEVTYFAYHINYGDYIKMIDTVEAFNVKDAIDKVEQRHAEGYPIRDIDIIEVVKVED